jgi:hypothetical protein
MSGSFLWNSSQDKLQASSLISFPPLRMVQQESPQLQPRFVQLGLAVADRAIEQGGDFAVVKTLRYHEAQR